MPKLMNNMEEGIVPGSSFKFSFTRPEDLGATEYTLVNIAVDVSYSVDDFKNELLEALKTAIQACKKSPRSDNLLLRVVTFNTSLQEVHGFIPLSSIDPDSYEEFDCCGGTALYDSVYDSVGSILAYAKTLTDMDFDVNAINFIITDGAENSSRQSNPNSIKDLVKKSKTNEELESIINVLIGINSGEASIFGMLENFKDEAGLDQFIEVQDTTPGKLAKFARFVSQSVSSQSQSLNSGGQSQLLSF
jgi:uncharacterized protein YegL